MTNIPPEANEAAAEALYLRDHSDDTPWELVEQQQHDVYAEDAISALTAALPHIEAAIREQVKAELRTEARKMRERQSHVTAFIDGVQVAANWAVSGGSDE